MADTIDIKDKIVTNEDLKIAYQLLKTHLDSLASISGNTITIGSNSLTVPTTSISGSTITIGSNTLTVPTASISGNTITINGKSVTVPTYSDGNGVSY